MAEEDGLLHCDFCEKTYKTERGLQNHLDEKHTAEQPLEESTVGLAEEQPEEQIAPSPEVLIPDTTAPPRVTVSIPTWKTPPELLRRAVESVLAQTVTDLRVVVTCDGSDDSELEVLDDVQDDRLVLTANGDNRGRFATDALNLELYGDSEWFAICDADDWVEPTWLESLLSAATDSVDVVLAPHYERARDATSDRLTRPRQWDRRFAWYAHMGACLWRTDWLREHGALTDRYRVGWDNVLTGAAHLLGRTAVIREATYHRENRAGSLTTSPATNARSNLRQQTIRELRTVWKRLLHGETDLSVAARLTSIPTGNHIHTTARILANAAPRSDNWVLPRGTQAELDVHLQQRKPKVLVEFGSGESTVVLARYAKATGAYVLSLEHSQRWLRRTQQLLSRERLRGVVDVRHAPLQQTEAGPTYRAELPDGIDFALIDGPSEGDGGRGATFTQLAPHLDPTAVVWLDDADRADERKAIQQWENAVASDEQEQPLWVRTVDLPHGLAELWRFDGPSVDEAYLNDDDVFVTVLTGKRPELLKQLIRSLPDGLLSSAVALHAGGDEETRRVLGNTLDRGGSLIEHEPDSDGKLRSIGENVSELAQVAAGSGRKYWLHLEDDWQLATLRDDWLETAKRALEDDAVAQVRLRHIGDPTLKRHMVTGQPIRWRDTQAGWLLASAHWTFNPSLIRTADIAKVFPVADESDAQHRAVDAGLTTVAQLYPGAFWHTGESASLRTRPT